MLLEIASQHTTFKPLLPILSEHNITLDAFISTPLRKFLNPFPRHLRLLATVFFSKVLEKCPKTFLPCLVDRSSLPLASNVLSPSACLCLHDHYIPQQTIYRHQANEEEDKDPFYVEDGEVKHNDNEISDDDGDRDSVGEYGEEWYEDEQSEEEIYEESDVEGNDADPLFRIGTLKSISIEKLCKLIEKLPSKDGIRMVDLSSMHLEREHFEAIVTMLLQFPHLEYVDLRNSSGIFTACR